MASTTPLPSWRWLLDNCPCPRCLHPITRERTVTLVDQPDVQPVSITTGEQSTVTVDWGHGHVGIFPVELLVERPELTVLTGDLTPLQRISHAELSTRRGMIRWLTAMLENGAIVVEETPDESGEVIRLAELVGYARPTNFGTIFDVESRPDPNNSAYTAAGLDLHTDLPNWANPPDFQFLHALANEAQGGDSMLADGVAVANALRASDPKAFEILATTPVPFRFHDDIDDIRFVAPIIQLDTQDQPVSIRFNNWIRDVDPFADEPFYEAYVTLWHMLRDPEHVLSLRLEAGDTVCFDNRRVLHGRGQFDPQSGRRHLQGCYVDRDMVESRLRRLSLG
ncbi:MAG TPA: TauD/TfdA family dioxygenase [Ilumatobacteraceae bacterium]|nr:TauD/TfdA family dioxygenase [Ilumatobacteraceae bacterium]